MKTVQDTVSRIICFGIIKDTTRRYLDKNNISWRHTDRGFVGKRSVWTYDFRACWLEETARENVKSYWCGGPDADYEEEFMSDNLDTSKT